MQIGTASINNPRLSPMSTNHAENDSKSYREMSCRFVKYKLDSCCINRDVLEMLFSVLYIYMSTQVVPYHSIPSILHVWSPIHDKIYRSNFGSTPIFSWVVSAFEKPTDENKNCILTLFISLLSHCIARRWPSPAQNMFQLNSCAYNTLS